MSDALILTRLRGGPHGGRELKTEAPTQLDIPIHEDTDSVAVYELQSINYADGGVWIVQPHYSTPTPTPGDGDVANYVYLRTHVNAEGVPRNADYQFCDGDD